MGFQAVAAVVLVLAALALVVYGAISPKKSIAVALVALLVAVLAAAGGWHAWAETGSVPWTLGYGVIVMAAAAVSVRHLVGRRP
jgi:hypothetical protein